MNSFDYDEIYRSPEQAWITLIGYGISALLLLILLISVEIHFFHKDDLAPRRTVLANSSTNTSSGSSPKGAKRRTFIFSRTKTKSYNPTNTSRASTHRSSQMVTTKQKVLKPIKYNTIAIISFCFLFSFVSLLMRILAIFWSFNFGCYWIEIPTVFFGISRGLLHLLFILRLHTSFGDSAYRINPCILIFWFICTGLLFILAFVYYIIDISNQTNENNDSCAGIGYVGAQIPFYIIDTINGLILVAVFIKRLTTLMHRQAQSLAEQVPDVKLLTLVTKLSTLVSVSVASSWILVMTIGLLLKYPGLSAAIDAVVNSICVAFCYQFYQGYYSILCLPCRRCCYFCCYTYHASLLKTGVGGIGGIGDDNADDENGIVSMTKGQMKNEFRKAMQLKTIPTKSTTAIKVPNASNDGQDNSIVTNNKNNNNNKNPKNHKKEKLETSENDKITIKQASIVIKYDDSSERRNVNESSTENN